MSYLKEEHDMEIFEGIEDIEIVDVIDVGDHVGRVDRIGRGDRVDEVVIIDTIEGCDTHETQQMREINRNSDGNENLSKECCYSSSSSSSYNVNNINVHYREIELTINASTAEEVIFKKHRVQIINKHSRAYIMEGVVTGYKLVGASYDPVIVLDFEDGRSFYNENFGYLMLFYI